MDSHRLNELASRWSRTFGSDFFFSELVAAYSEPHRFYHTLEHIESGFDVMDEVFPSANTPVNMAWWFHDFVYDSKEKDNEEASAWFAARIVPAEHRDHVVSLIMATQNHVPFDFDSALLLDVDLSILSASPIVFDKYEENIQREYDWVPPEDYLRGRTAVLQSFLARPRIYCTEGMTSREAAARENIRRSLKALTVQSILP